MQLIHKEIEPLLVIFFEVCFFIIILFCFSDPENIKIRYTLKIRTGCFMSNSRWGLPCITLKLVCILTSRVAFYAFWDLLSETGIFCLKKKTLETAFSQVLQVILIQVVCKLHFE